MIAIPTSRVSFDSQTRRMYRSWKIGLNSHARSETGSAPGWAGVSGGFGEAVATTPPELTGTIPDELQADTMSATPTSRSSTSSSSRRGRGSDTPSCLT